MGSKTDHKIEVHLVTFSIMFIYGQTGDSSGLQISNKNALFSSVTVVNSACVSSAILKFKIIFFSVKISV